MKNENNYCFTYCILLHLLITILFFYLQLLKVKGFDIIKNRL